jgi:hypothetical protein
MSYDEEEYNSEEYNSEDGNDASNTSDGELEEVFEEDTPAAAAKDRKENSAYYLDVAAAVERDRDAKYSDEENDEDEPSSPVAEYTATNVTWTYENKNIPDDIDKELLKTIEYTECPINDDKSSINIRRGNNKWYFSGFSNKCYVEYTVSPGSEKCNIDVFRCNHDDDDVIPRGSGRCLLLKLLQSLIIEKQIEQVTVTAKPLIYKSEYKGKSAEEIEEFENAKNIHLRKYYNDIGFMPKKIISDTTSNDNHFIAPILQIIYNILIYRKTPSEIDEINRKLKSSSTESAGGFKKTRKTKRRRHKKTKRRIKRRQTKKTKRRQTKKTKRKR